MIENHIIIVLSVLKLLSEPGAVDELGIGIIRDGFANILFPGTSAIQTRVKYFFIVPYLMLTLEKQKALKPYEFSNLLGKKETDLIDILANENLTISEYIKMFLSVRERKIR